MPPTSFFTTRDGDVIIRAAQEPGPTRDFRVHKFILSLASSVFKDMFTLPEPPDQNHPESPEVPVVDVSDPPKIIDTILRLIYPGVEPPKISDVSTLSALFSTADKYNITSIYPVLKESMKSFLPRDSFTVYLIACRLGLLEEAKEAARVSALSSMSGQDHSEAVKHISGPDLYRFVRFVQERERVGRSKIENCLNWYHMLGSGDCDHYPSGAEFYSRLTKVVQDEFTANPCLEFKDLFEVFDRIQDPPHGCSPPPDPADSYYEMGDDEPFSCQLLPMSIRRNLTRVVEKLKELERSLLQQVFEK